ncbi:MAG: 3-oxoacyl-[Bacteroidales bacterium]|nr:3-oxoacyl-[acyl-carrier-protein] reductase [Bacteroidales bacterium]
MKILEGKVALVTGGTRGIGRAIVLKLASAGASIAFTGQRESDALRQTESDLLNLGVKCKAYISNASDYSLTQELVSEVHKEFGKIDILVNNAGITKDTLLMRMSEEQWDDVINVNLKSTFNFTKAVVPIMARQRQGSIVNISSIVGLNGNPGQANYSASKAGIIGLTKSVAKEMGARNIRVNAVAPGFIATEMTDALPQEVKDEYAKRISLRRLGQGEDIANVVMFLASDLAAYVTGEVLTVDGGMM